MSGTIQGHHITTPHATQHPCEPTGLIIALSATEDRPHILYVYANSSIILFFFRTGKDIASAAGQLIEGQDALKPEAPLRHDKKFLQSSYHYGYRPHGTMMPVLTSLLATLPQFLRRLAGARRLTDILTVQD